MKVIPVLMLATLGFCAALFVTLLGCTAHGSWDILYELQNPTDDLPDSSPDTDPAPDGPLTFTVDASGGGDYTTIRDAVAASGAGYTIVVAAGSYGSEGAAGDPIVVDVENLRIQGAFAGVSGHHASRIGHGVVDESGVRAGEAFVVSVTPETEINDPLRITAAGVTIDGVTFDVTAIFGFSGDVELTGGSRAVDFFSGSTIINSRFIETAGGDVGANNQGELATTQSHIHNLTISGNAFFGEAPGVQIGSADFTGRIDIIGNSIVDGSLNITVGPGSTADITVSGNSISGSTAFGDNPFGLIGSGFAADGVPSAVLAQLNDFAAENELFGGVVTLTGSDGDDDMSVFASSLRDFFFGGKGNDTIIGRSGNDRLGGGGGDDEIDGGAGDDELLGDGNFASQQGIPGNDILLGGPGDDTLRGGPGDDILDGGDGSDTAVYSGEQTAYNVTVDDGGTPMDPSDDVTTVVHNGGQDGTDTLTSIENFTWNSP
jgi:hypothetical protein